MTRAWACLAALLLSACVYVPRTTEVYDPGCRIMAREMVLEEVHVASLRSCQDKGCAMVLVTVGAAAVAASVVSGSIVVAGNVVYWLEKQGRCRRD